MNMLMLPLSRFYLSLWMDKSFMKKVNKVREMIGNSFFNEVEEIINKVWVIMNKVRYKFFIKVNG